MDAVRESAMRSKDASFAMQGLSRESRDQALQAVAEGLVADADGIVAANLEDMAEAERQGLPKVLIKRLSYDRAKIEESVRSIHSLMGQEDPVGKLLASTELDSGLILEKVTCPIGVIAVIFESRPDALVQISTLCLKSGNAVMLKGGSEAKRTNQALASSIIGSIRKLDERFHDAVQLLSSREEVQRLLAQDDLVDLIIPRGSNELVRSIQSSTRIPVLGHAAGVCHTYVDSDADLEMAVEVCYDAKVQYPAVCNAMETLLVHRSVAKAFLPRMASRYAQAKVELRGDEETRGIIEASEASEADWSDRVQRPGAGHQGRPLIGGGGPAHQPLRLTSFRRYHHQGRDQGSGLHVLGRLQLRDVELLHPLRRRLPLRSGGGGGHIHQQDPCPGTGRPGGAGNIQMEAIR